MWEREKILVTSIFSLFHNVLKGFYFWVVESWNCVVKSWLFTTQSWLLTTLKTRSLKTLWETEKMLVTSIFSFFPQCFLPCQREKSAFYQHLICHLQNSLNLVRAQILSQCRILTHQRDIAVENIVRKGEIAWNKQFLLFSQCSLPYMALIFHFKCTLKCCLQIV